MYTWNWLRYNLFHILQPNNNFSDQALDPAGQQAKFPEVTAKMHHIKTL
jgi:hypothetical protein